MAAVSLAIRASEPPPGLDRVKQATEGLSVPALSSSKTTLNQTKLVMTHNASVAISSSLQALFTICLLGPEEEAASVVFLYTR